jgi:ADP-ribosylglycohydrolase
MSLDRYRGSILGLAVGDALGAPVEFKRPGSFEPVTGMSSGGAFGLRPGQWTDDTSLALCLAESLVETNGFDLIDQLDRYVRWYREGHLSSTGACFDIGNTTEMALTRYEATKDPYSGPTDPSTAGNGSIMRLVSVPLAYAKDFATAVERSGESSKTTHGALEAVDSCRYLGGLIAASVTGVEKTEFLSNRYSQQPGYWTENPLCEKVDAIADGSFKEKSPPEIKGSGYVIDCLEAALWAFYKTDSFREGCLLAVNLGDDADTTGAVYGQLAGAYYGASGIPKDWLQDLTLGSLVQSFADRLYEMAGSISP